MEILNKIKPYFNWYWSKKWLRNISISVILTYLIVFQNFLWLFGSIPPSEELKNPPLPTASELYAANGQLIGKYYRENRSSVKMEEVSPYFVKGLISTEDVRFYEHHGIDWQAIGSVIWYTVKGDKRGGSTITQQLAKNLFKTRKTNRGLFSKIPGLSTVSSKIKEWIVAVRLEKNFDKDHILLLYVNTVDFGCNSFGIKAASKTFFNKKPKDLSLSESAALVGVLKATTSYSPVLHPEKCLERRNVVLGQMKKYKVIDDKEYKRGLQKPLKLNLNLDDPTDSPVPYIRAAVANQLTEWCSENGFDLYADGLKIYTSIDLTVQKHAETAMRQHMSALQRKFDNHWGKEDPWRNEKKNVIPNFLKNAMRTTALYKGLSEKFDGDTISIDSALNAPKKMTIFAYEGYRKVKMSSYDSLAHYKKLLRCGFLTMDPNNGEIKSWVGGIDYNFFKIDHVNQTKRQPGSTFKPFVYATAIQQGLGPCDTRTDQYLKYEYEEDGEQKVWEPRNSTRVFSGKELTLRRAMAASINSVTAQLTKEVDPKNVMAMAKKLGIKSEIKPVPSIGLGTGEVSLMELLSSYAPFMNGGFSVEPVLVTKILNKDGLELATFSTKKEQVLDPETAWLMTYMFRGTVDEYGGTSQGLFAYNVFGNGSHLGGKTGTSNNYSDGWYMGLTSELIGGVWVGAEDRSVHFKNSANGEALRTALPMFGLFLDKLYHDKKSKYRPSKYPECPLKVEKNHECWTSGPILSDSLSSDSLALDSMRVDTTTEEARERRRLFGRLFKKDKDSTNRREK